MSTWKGAATRGERVHQLPAGQLSGGGCAGLRSLRAWRACVGGMARTRAKGGACRRVRAHTVTLERAHACQGRSVPGYIITVVRDGCCWEVTHRFSEWRELDKSR